MTDHQLPSPSARAVPEASQQTASLLDLMSEGFHMLLLIRRGQMPAENQTFFGHARRYLNSTQLKITEAGHKEEDAFLAKYALCAAIDEALLSGPDELVKGAWQLQSLQFSLFGDQLGGERFFEHLETVRGKGALKVAVLEVYYLCLLMGFKGQFQLESADKLGLLIARVGDEIKAHKGKRSSFAPRWSAPDNISHALRRHVPLWAPIFVVSALALTCFGTLRMSLSKETDAQIAGYHQLIQLPARTANITITLP